MPTKYKTAKEFAHRLLDGTDRGDRLSFGTNLFIMFLIVLNISTYMAGTVDTIDERFGWHIAVFDIFCVFVFTVEYILRVWACTADERYSEPVRGRIRFMFTPYAIIDLLAILPFYMPVVIGDEGAERILRIFRLFRLFKIARYTESMNLITNVFRKKSHELAITTLFISIWLVFVSSIMYYVERGAQPDVFSSIPASIYWGIITLTTVGYGDVVPITPLGRALGSIIALIGIAFFALPAGILASGFSEVLEERHRGARYCPHCGEEVGVLEQHPPEGTEDDNTRDNME